MAKITLIFSVLLILLGLIGFYGTGAIHHTALIPAWIGLVLGFGGLLSISESEARRKLFAHVNVTIALLTFIGDAVEIARNLIKGGANSTALASKLALAVLLLVYIVLCVRSFIAARRSGKV